MSKPRFFSFRKAYDRAEPCSTTGFLPFAVLVLRQIERKSCSILPHEEILAAGTPRKRLDQHPSRAKARTGEKWRLSLLVESAKLRVIPPSNQRFTATGTEPVVFDCAAAPSAQFYTLGRYPAHHRYRMIDNDSALKLYLREISQIPLLRREEEVELAHRIQKGDAAARQKMIQANLRLVVKIAHDYSTSGLPLLDLISEGNIGLMKAVDRFDPSKGGKLSTYAAWWIKQSIKRALANQSKTIRLPVHLVDKIARMRRVAIRLAEEFGREPTDDELANEMGIAASRVGELRTIAIQPASLNASVGEEEGGTSLGELVKDENAIDPSSIMQSENLKKTVMELLPALDARERKILALRFGLEGNEEMTLEEIGKRFHVTRERIRQLQNIALRKVRRALEKKEKRQLVR